jgi:hypothetical protein
MKRPSSGQTKSSQVIPGSPLYHPRFFQLHEAVRRAIPTAAGRLRIRAAWGDMGWKSRFGYWIFGLGNMTMTMAVGITLGSPLQPTYIHPALCSHDNNHVTYIIQNLLVVCAKSLTLR